MQRELWATLVELVDSTRPLAAEASLIRVEQLLLDMPLEVEFRRTVQGFTFFSDVPSWRWRTVFDQEPGRLKISCGDQGVLA